MGAERPTVALVHGLTAIPAVWDDVAANLRRDHEVFVPALLGHVGGSPWSEQSNTGIGPMVDDLERAFDMAGIERAHIAGSSLGGWIALELAARGRAESVLALCPAGFWDGPADPDVDRLEQLFAREYKSTRRSRWALPLLMAIPRMRRFAFQSLAVHGERIPRRKAVQAADGMLGCDAYPDIFDSPTIEGARRLEGLGCPVSVLMASEDVMFPPPVYSPRVAGRVPEAKVEVLEGLGHVPMIDNPELVAERIRAWIAR